LQPRLHFPRPNALFRRPPGLYSEVRSDVFSKANQPYNVANTQAEVIMPAKVKWESDERLAVLMEFEGECTFPEFHEASAQAHNLIRSVSHKVDLIVWHKGTFPPGNLMLHFKAAMKDQPANIGHVVVINPKMKPFLIKLADVFSKVFPAKSPIKVVNTLDDAHAVLVKRPVDTKIPAN
jgi:hypothetical protein